MAASTSTASSSAGSNASYKKLKEDFVSGLSGGSVSEINSVTAVATVAVLLWSVLQARHSFFRDETAISAVVDFLINVCAFLLAITLYSSTPLLLSGLLLAPACLVLALPRRLAARRKPRLPPCSKTRQPSGPGHEMGRSTVASLTSLPLRPFLTHYRGAMLVSTCLAILAVDFRLFPRRFAKVETWGTSLMDVGVGSFVFSAGLVGARPVLKQRAEGRKLPLHRRLLHSTRHSLPLLLLGTARTLSVKGLDYAEHVTEYGVHWNFFFTLALLPPFVAVFQDALQVVPRYAALALILSVLHQVVLESTSLKTFILLAPRTDFLSSNREGICSFVGYLAIFLAGQDAGMYMLPRKRGAEGKASAAAQRQNVLLALACWTGVWYTLYYLITSPVHGAGVDVSRRLANLPYVLWIAAFNNMSILGYCVVDTVCFPAGHDARDAETEREAYQTATSRVLRSYNRNGLAVFLLANLLTGLVNLTVPTLHVGPVATMGILVGYAAVVTGVAVALDAYEVTIKL